MPDRQSLIVDVKHRTENFELNVSFHLDRWPAVLFGPSGSGKTTLLRILAGLEKPLSARIQFGMEIFADTQAGTYSRPGSGKVQLVTQRAALFPHMSVRDNVGFGLRKAERKGRPVEELLALLRIADLADRRPRELSGGERQRVALARALAPNPELLLLDEAFAGLDNKLKQEIMADLDTLLKKGNTCVLHVTHEVSDAFLLKAHVICIREGLVVAQGEPRTMLEHEREDLLRLLSLPGSDTEKNGL